jgi:hypothetical protein
MFPWLPQPERGGAAPLDFSFFFTRAHSHGLEPETGLGCPFERIRRNRHLPVSLPGRRDRRGVYLTVGGCDEVKPAASYSAALSHYRAPRTKSNLAHCNRWSRPLRYATEMHQSG